MSKIRSRLINYIESSEDSVFLTSELTRAGGGSYKQTARIILSLIRSSLLYRISYGVYVKMQKTTVGDMFRPSVKSVLAMFKSALEKLNISYDIPVELKNYNSNKSNHLPMRSILVVKQKTVRKIQYNNSILLYEYV